MSKKLRLILILTAAFLAAACLFLFLLWKGILRLNHPSAQVYPVRGVDVSSYQGEIDWDSLAAQDISFAFIKATEGSSLVDPYFAYNYEQAKKTPLRIGAYHFFSYDSSGLTQAENFIAQVEKYDNMLPPVVDIEFYGDKAENPPSKEAVDQELQSLLDRLEAHYGMKPILYATYHSYNLYLKNSYLDYDIWIRNVYTYPYFLDERDWTFWQYTDKEQWNGYSGPEKCIDVNVFNGTEEEFAGYGKESNADCF